MPCTTRPGGLPKQGSCKIGGVPAACREGASLTMKLKASLGVALNGGGVMALLIRHGLRTPWGY